EMSRGLGDVYKRQRQERGAPRGQSAPPANNAMAALFANAKQLKKK
ncbi:hypothetical protein, partial [Pseudomonas aeruginosa]